MEDHLTRPSPGSAVASTLDGPPKALEVPNSFTPSQDLSGLEHINTGLHLSSFSASQAQTNYHRPMRVSLDEWYRRNDGPWTGLAPTHADAGLPSTRGSLRANAIFQYHDNAVPSECSTMLPSDSGYGSYGAKRSVANNSVCDETFDRNTETQSVIGQLHSELTFSSFGSELLPRSELDHGDPWPLTQGAPKSSDHHSPLNGASIICETCNKPLKTHSELKKHRQRHTKPYHCDVVGCARRDGFSTSNDLERHKRSVHPQTDAAGNRYLCPIGSCKSRGKIWPRADNFRAHLKRVHSNEVVSDDELDRYVVPRPQPPPAVLSDLAREGINTDLSHFSGFPSGPDNLPRSYLQSPIIEISNEPNPTENQNQLRTDDPLALENPPRRFPPLPKIDTSVSFRVNQDTDFPVDSLETAEDVSARDPQTISQGPFLKASTFNRDEPLLTDTGIARSSDPECEASLPKYEAGDGLHKPHDEPKEFSPLDVESPRPLEEAKEVDADTQDSPEPGSQQIPKAALHAVDLNDQTEVVKLLETLQHTGLLKKLGYKKESSVEPDTKRVETASAPGQSHQYPCSKCKKTFGRRCELKKHEKRHSKPYGCTFPTCSKRFGSKNDWKRHENSQHFLLEVWRCDVQCSDLPSDICGKVAHRREPFRVHLQTYHGMQDRKALETKLESCRIGRNCEARFWCGFCQAIVESKQKGLGAWSERFDHIDDHFAGRNNFTRKEISDWKNVDPDQPSKDLSAPDSDDSDGSPSPPPAGPSKSDIANLGRLEKQVLQSSKARRRKGMDSDGRAAKRRRPPAQRYRFVCCQCGEVMPETNRVCINFACDHHQCDRCNAFIPSDLED